MRRWMSIITLAALALALAAGWTIGQLAGGGSGDAEQIVRAIPTLEPTVIPTASIPTREIIATPEATIGSDIVIASPAVASTPSPAIQRPTSVPEAP